MDHRTEVAIIAVMDGERIYREIPVFTHSELINELRSGDARRMAEAISSAVRHEDDWKWTQEQCLHFLTHSEIEVRWAAATGLGDLAFFLHRPIDHRRVVAALSLAAEDTAIYDPASFSISLINQRFPPD